MQAEGAETGDFLDGGGEMAQLIRSFDWSKTPLKSIEGWPPVLKATTSLILRSPVPLVTLWGELGIMIYNDAYSRFAGGRHPQLLGSEVRKGWPEVADWNDNVMKVGLKGGTLSYRDQLLVLLRRGRPEDVWLDLDYSPITDEAGRPVGVIAIVVEITEKKLVLQRAAALAELGEVIRTISDPDELAYAAGELLGRELQASRAGYGPLNTDADTIILGRNYSAPGMRNLGGAFPLRDYGSFIDELKRGDAVVINDTATDPRTRDNSAALEGVNVRSLVNIPVTEQGGLVAMLYVNTASPRIWNEEEIAFLREVADRIRTAIERRRAEEAVRQNAERLAFLDALGRETARNNDADAVLDVTTRMLGAFLRASICAYADMETDQDHFTIRGDWSAPGSPSIRGYYSLADFGALAVDRLSQGRPLIISDNNTELPPHEAAAFQALGISATICVPLVKEGRLTALMAVHHKAPHHWTENELALLREVTERSWAHIERVRSAIVLEQQEELLRLATGAAAIGTWDFDPVTGALNWDARCKAVFGLPSNAVVTYDTFLAGLHPQDRDRTHASVMEALQPGGSGTYDVEYRTIGPQDGAQRWVAATGQGIFADGKAVRFIGTVQDITARKQAEMALSDETKALDLLNSTASRLAAELDLNRLVQTVVDAGVAFSGAQFGAFFYNVVDAKGESYMLYAISGVDPAHFSKFPMPRNTAVFAPTFAGDGIVRSADITKDPRYGHNAPRKGMPEGHLPVRSYLAVPVISRSGEVIGGLFFGHEKTDMFDAKSERLMTGLAAQAAIGIDNARLFQAEQRLNQTLESRVEERSAALLQAQQALQQAQKMEAIGNLTGGIAHDFNNLLMAVLGSLELLRKRMPDEPGLTRLIDNAMEGARRGSSLTRRMLAFARRQDLKTERIEIPQLVQGMTDLLERALGPTISVKSTFPERLAAVETDPNQLESALLNLAVNARDAMNGEGDIVISAREAEIAEASGTLKPGSYICLSLTDSGEGMDEETRKRAAEPFFTTKGVGKGTGLGLSMVQGLAEQSGGALLIHSRRGEGTTAEIWLPAALAAQAGEPAAVSASQPAPVSAPVGKLSILAIDDDPLVLMNTADMLEDLGHAVTAVGSATDALKLLKQGSTFDLAISDHAMPGMTGSQFALEAARDHSSLKVLLATGYAELPSGSDLGLPRLSKPFNQGELAAAIAKLMA